MRLRQWVIWGDSARVRWIVEPVKALVAGLTGALLVLFSVLLAALPFILVVGVIAGAIYLIANG